MPYLPSAELPSHELHEVGLLRHRQLDVRVALRSRRFLKEPLVELGEVLLPPAAIFGNLSDRDRLFGERASPVLDGPRRQRGERHGRERERERSQLSSGERVQRR